MKKLFSKKKIERIIKTFIEAFLSYLAVNIMNTNLSSKSALHSLFAGAIGSAICVLLNYGEDKEKLIVKNNKNES